MLTKVEHLTVIRCSWSLTTHHQAIFKRYLQIVPKVVEITETSHTTRTDWFTGANFNMSYTHFMMLTNLELLTVIRSSWSLNSHHRGYNLHSVSLSQSTLGEGFVSVPEYSGRRSLAWARVLWQQVFILSQSTLGEGFGPKPVYSGNRSLPEPEYSGREVWAWDRVLWEEVLGLTQSTLGGSFWPEPEYSGRGFWASARVLWEEVLGHSQSTYSEEE